MNEFFLGNERNLCELLPFANYVQQKSMFHFSEKFEESDLSDFCTRFVLEFKFSLDST